MHLRHPRRWVRARLHRRLFAWFGVAIVLTLFAASVAVRVAGPGRGHPHGRFPFLLALAVGGGALWALSGIVARRIARPLMELSRVASEIGSGQLRSRIRLGRHAPGEIGQLADSIHDMATRIERQLEDQRELLAGVSHEIRTPLARLRVLVEIIRDAGASREHLDGMEREIREIDELVGELLASSRLDFSALERRPLAAVDVAVTALERAGQPRELLDDGSGGATISADPTLLGRGLANLLENAIKYGGGVSSLRIARRGTAVSFCVDDEGPGFSAEFLPRALDSFTRAGSSERTGTSLGLGLALVRRIAEAHGGQAFAENRPGGGARVGFEIPCGTVPEARRTV